MIQNDLYINNLHRKYGHKHIEHAPPMANRITLLKKDILKQGLPQHFDSGKIDVNDRGDLIFILNSGDTMAFVDVPDKFLNNKL